MNSKDLASIADTQWYRLRRSSCQRLPARRGSALGRRRIRQTEPGLCLTLIALALLTSQAVASPASSSPARDVTFNRDVAPIVFGQCASCHQPGGSAPFSLLTYAEVRRRAQQIRDATASRYMPPWLPEPGSVRFQGDRRLTDEQIQVLAQWAESEMPEGDPSDLPETPRFVDGWQLGMPDLVVRMPEPYMLPAAGPDVFRNFVIPLPIERKRYVKAVEFRPGNRRVVHHAEILVDRKRWARQMSQRDPEPGYDGMQPGRAVRPEGQFVGWTPGKVPDMGSADMAWAVYPGTDMIAQLHLQPSGKTEQIQSEIGIHFSDKPPVRHPVVIRIGSQIIDIPAGDAAYTTEDSYRLPIDVEVLGLYPHAHYLGKTMHGWAVLPDGTKQWLIRIDDWDFNWQDSYRLLRPLALPRGTTLHMRYTFDNSSANVRNPHTPPRRVRWGPESTDEMGDLWIQVVPVRTEDLPVLKRDYQAQGLQSDIACHEKLLRDEPEQVFFMRYLASLYKLAGRFADARTVLEDCIRVQPDLAHTHNDLAVILANEGELEQAITHVRRALELDPEQPAGHYNLANAYRERKQWKEAIRHYERAIALQPAFVEAHINLAITFRDIGRRDRTIQHFRQALSIDPDDAWTHFNLGKAIQAAGRPREALGHLAEAARMAPDKPAFHLSLGAAQLKQGQRHAALDSLERATRLAPDWPAPYNAMAWALVTSPDVDQRAKAAAFAERAAALTQHQDPVLLDTLAVAYAAGGRMEDARRTARIALALADKAGRKGLVAHIRDRLKRFGPGPDGPANTVPDR